MYEPPDALSRVMQGIHPMTATNGEVTITRPEDGGYQVAGSFFSCWPALIEALQKQGVDIHTGWSRLRVTRKQEKVSPTRKGKRK